MTALKSMLSPDGRMQLAVFIGFLVLIYTMTTQRHLIAYMPVIYLCFFTAFIFNQQPKLKFNIDWCVSLLIITLVALAASALSENQPYSFARLVLYRDLFLFSFSLYLVLHSQLISLSNAILLSIVCAFLLVSPLTLIEYLDYSKAINVSDSRYIDPKLSYYGHIRHFSYHAFIASCCAAILFLNTAKYRAALGVVCLVCVSVLIASTGRAAILAFLIFISLLSFKLYNLMQTIKIGAICLLLVIGLLALLSFTPYSVLTGSIIERTAQMGSVDQVLSGRLSYWHGALLSVFQNPLLGLGPDGFRWSEGKIPTAVQPHGVLIQLVVEYGWLGGSVIFYRCWLFFAPMCRNLRNDSGLQKYRLCLAVFFLGYLLYSLVDGLFYHALPMLHLAILVPLLFVYTQKQILSPANQ